MKAKRLTLCGILTAAALTVFVLESQIPPLVPIPGVKPGLSNLVTLFALLYLTPKETFLILTARILLSSIFTSAPSAMLYSFVGGFLCLGCEVFLVKFCKIPFIWAVSAVGAMIHNLGQILTAAWAVHSVSVFLYLPFLCITGMICGLFCGICIHLLDRKYRNRIQTFLS